MVGPVTSGVGFVLCSVGCTRRNGSELPSLGNDRGNARHGPPGGGTAGRPAGDRDPVTRRQRYPSETVSTRYVFAATTLPFNRCAARSDADMDGGREWLRRPGARAGLRGGEADWTGSDGHPIGSGWSRSPSRSYCSGGPAGVGRPSPARGGPVLHIPTVLGAVVVIYNLPGVRQALKLDGELLADLFQARVTRWDAKAVARANPGVHLPALAVVPVYRADSSGTTATF